MKPSAGINAAGKKIALSAEGIQYAKKHDTAMAEVIACSQSFATFLKYWKVRDPASQSIFTLGDELWPGQHRFLWASKKYDYIYSLKARKLGYTTLGVAYDGWCLRFRDSQARVHLFSRNENAAVDLMERLKFGLNRLPEWLQLPVVHQTQKMIRIDAGGDDERVAEAYPSSEETAVEQSATHAHVDEWWRMRNPGKVWQAIGPSIFGSCHIITTGLGPVGYPADFWRTALAGDSKFYALFTPATARPDRDEEWFRLQRATMTELQFRQEYPLTWQDALAGAEDYVFQPSELNEAVKGCRGPAPPQEGRKYVKAWDIARHRDAAVGIVLDITDNIRHVVHYQRHRGMAYPVLQTRIEALHDLYPGPTVIEDNGAGQAVRENLRIRDKELLGFKTTQSTKARMIAGLQLAFQSRQLKYDSTTCHQLDDELRMYMYDDKHLTQDSVIALGIANESALAAYRFAPAGKIRPILTWS